MCDARINDFDVVEELRFFFGKIITVRWGENMYYQIHFEIFKHIFHTNIELLQKLIFFSVVFCKFLNTSNEHHKN